MAIARGFNILPTGFGQMTMAVQDVARQAFGGRTGGTRRRKKKASPKATRKRRVKRAVRAAGGGKFVKGSAAAKRHMAKLRKMVKRKR